MRQKNKRFQHIFGSQKIIAGVQVGKCGAGGRRAQEKIAVFVSY